MGQWTIEPSLGSHRVRDEVDKLKTELEDLEVLVREVVQNSLDAGTEQESGFVSVRFRTKRLVGDAKRQFLQALSIDDYAEHARLSMEFQRRNAARHSVRRNEVVIDEQDLKVLDPLNLSIPLDLLYIEDFGTTGLTGQEFDSEVGSRFCACCRDSEFSVKQFKQSGGSYGKGKNVLWRHSCSRIVLFHSTLSEPYEGESSRFIGVGKLPWHSLPDATRDQGRFSGRCDFGNSDGLSILGQGARTLGRQFGLDRQSDQTGTSICLVGFESISDCDWEEVPSRICRIAEDYYWPAIREGRIEITAMMDGGQEVEALPDNREALAPFVRAYESARREREGRVAAQPLDVPLRECGGRVQSNLTVGCEVLAEPMSNTEQTRADTDHVALIRGAGMVVNYVPVRPQRIGADRYAGVCLAGLADPSVADPFDIDASDPAAALEALLSFSEPEAHDRWDPNAFGGMNWRGAHTAVRNVKKLIRKIVTELVGGESDPEEGRSIPELSRRFRVGGGESTERRTLSIHKTSDPAVDADGNVRYRVRIDRLQEAEGSNGRLRVRLKAVQIDSVSSARPRTEALNVASVVVEGRPVAVESKRGSSYFEVDLADHEFPLAMEVVAQVAAQPTGEAAHCGLAVSCELVAAKAVDEEAGA